MKSLLLVLLLWLPAAALPASSPSAQGLNVGVLDELDREFQAGTFGEVDGFLVMRNGFLVCEKSYPRQYIRPTSPPGPYNYDDPDWHPWHGPGLHTLQSVTKSVTSALI